MNNNNILIIIRAVESLGVPCTPPLHDVHLKSQLVECEQLGLTALNTLIIMMIITILIMITIMNNTNNAATTTTTITNNAAP